MNKEKSNQELRDFFNSIEEKNDIKFNSFYNQYNSLIKKTAFSVVKNESESEDVMQMVFLKIFNMPKVLFPKENELNWLYRVTKNMAIDYIRKNKKIVDIDEIYTIADSQDIISASIDKISYNQIISQLPEKEQEILSLKVISGLSFKEIGILLNLPISTVSWTYYKSIKTLKILLSNLFITLITFGIYTIRKNNVPKAGEVFIPTNEIINTIDISHDVKKFIFLNNILLVLTIVFALISVYFLIIFIKNHKKSVLNRLKVK